MSITRVDETRCLFCGKLLDSIGSAAGNPDDEAPQPGDPIACIRCGAVATISADRRTLRPFTDKEIAILRADKEWMAELGRLVETIHFCTETGFPGSIDPTKVN